MELMQALGVTAQEIDIRPSCLQMLRDLDHPYARGEPVYDITFENVQAGERTSHLFRLANQNRGFVVGTGDLSELALGWCTYGVGDQMSHYNVNGSVPKTLVRYLVAWAAQTDRFGGASRAVLERIVGATISPELVPADPGGAAQDTEHAVGPYDLQDFTLYYLTRFGYRPEKIAFLAWHAWRDAASGRWPDLVPASRRRAYDLDTIVKWQRVFLDRFVRRAQYKRSAMPNGPKVGSGGSLSPRGDWRAPSDASAQPWLRRLERIGSGGHPRVAAFKRAGDA
jgi:NAD+ synthase (glutamine-hydrolysing)